jgi:hypothetical protein
MWQTRLKTVNSARVPKVAVQQKSDGYGSTKTKQEGSVIRAEQKKVKM